MPKWIKNRKTAVAAALFLAFTFCVYAPFEMYLGNREEFWFQLTDFWWIPVATGSILFVGMIFVSGFLKGKLLKIYEAFVFSGGLAAYMQGNFLNLDVGVQNGAKIYWSEYRYRFAGNLLVWMFLLFLPVILMVLKPVITEKIILTAAAFLTAIQAAALAVLVIPVLFDGGEKEPVEFFSEEGCFTLAEDKNTIVFLLDMFDGAYLKEIIREEPEIQDRLEGFTHFVNATGKYNTTRNSLMKLMTGKDYLNEPECHEWMEGVAKERLYIDELLENGYEIGLYMGESIVPARIRKAAVNDTYAHMRVGDYAGLWKNLYKFVTNKYFPDICKPRWWMFGTEFDVLKKADGEFAMWNPENTQFFSDLESRGLSLDSGKKKYKFIYLNGAHYPYRNDERGRSVEADSVDAISCARGALEIVLEYLEQMKELGVYDAASIVIMADHGYYYDGVLTNPVLAVKPAGSTGRMQESKAPVSHDDFAATILQLSGVHQSDAYGRSVFDVDETENRERLFYQYYLSEREHDNWRLIEYRIDAEENDRENFHLTDVEYTWDGRKISHARFCKTCQENRKVSGEYDPPRLVHEKADNYPE